MVGAVEPANSLEPEIQVQCPEHNDQISTVLKYQDMIRVPANNYYPRDFFIHRASISTAVTFWKRRAISLC